MFEETRPLPEDTRPLQQLALTSVVQYYLEEQASVSGGEVAGGARGGRTTDGASAAGAGMASARVAKEAVKMAQEANSRHHSLEMRAAEGVGKDAVTGKTNVGGIWSVRQSDRSPLLHTVSQFVSGVDVTSVSLDANTSVSLHSSSLLNANTRAKLGQRANGKGATVAWGGAWSAAITLGLAWFLHQHKARLMRMPGANRDRWVGRCEMAAWALMLWMWTRRWSTRQALT